MSVSNHKPAKRKHCGDRFRVAFIACIAGDCTLYMYINKSRGAAVRQYSNPKPVSTGDVADTAADSAAVETLMAPPRNGPGTVFLPSAEVFARPGEKTARFGATKLN
jgi:hypothetical protein